MTPRLARPAAWAAAIALALSSFVAPSATAATPDLPSETALEGVLQVLPDETGLGHADTGTPTGDTVVLVTDDGTRVELVGEPVQHAVSGDRFEGVVEVTDAIAQAIDGDPDEAALGSVVAEASEALDTPLEVVEAELTPTVQAAAAAAAHTVDVMYLAPAGSAVPTASAIDAAIARLSEYWSSQSDGQIAQVTRASDVKYATMSKAAGLCDPDTTWIYAAGEAGFDRTGPSEDPDSYYWAGGHAAHLVVLVPDSVCTVGSGLGTVGSVHAGGVTWSSVAADPLDWDLVLFHEFGHNLGLGHSNVTECPLPTIDGTGCTQREYYDFYDVMGGGISYNNGLFTNTRNVGALNVSQKANLGALTLTGADPSLITVTAAAGSTQRFTLQRASADSGLRGLDVVDQGTGAHLYVEYRSGTGRDAASFYTTISPYVATYSPGVRVLKLVRCVPGAASCAGAASTVLRNSENGRLSYAAGEVFTSQESTLPGARIEVVSTDGDAAVVDVSFDERSRTLTTATPTVSGTAKVGLKLTAKPGTWSIGTALSYRWYVGGTAVSGATKSTFTPTASHAGKTVTVKVTGKRAGFTTASTTSKATAKVAKASTLKKATPKISGTVKVGKKLTAKPGAWTSGTTFTYQWYVGGKAVSKATKSTFTLRSSDKGKTVKVKVTGKKAGYTTASKVSTSTSRVK
ncbi:hypothetical protein ACFQRL_02795 [Microbacterium fluvii]|uniref:Gametolysin peptidase M11 n=1 Tax=Microbacterium fluvii TaxID=415215 RepID=A0ABW2HDT9_9MICO|nr:hypothetical protein [Microbacterium fluvii]MCU4671521.1 hypothetical protein [Microbacterium fluvii]